MAQLTCNVTHGAAEGQDKCAETVASGAPPSHGLWEIQHGEE